MNRIQTEIMSIIFCMMVILSGITAANIISTTVENESKLQFYNSIPLAFSGNILYVGGSGPGNFSHIQDAIDNASNGDTVFVFDDSSPYNEGVEVNKPLYIIGENRDTTIIDGEDVFIEDGIVVDIHSDQVTFCGFTIVNRFKGIELYGAGNITIFNNKFQNIEHAIYLHGSSNNTIENNLIIEGEDIVFDFTGIYLYDADNNVFANNTVIVKKWNKFDSGLQIGRSKDNIFSNNAFFNCSILSWEQGFANNFFEGNTCNGKPIICLQGKSDQIIDDAAQVALIDCENILVTNLELTQLHTAIILSNCQNCEISNCTITQSYVGIRIFSSLHNTISENIIMNGLPKLLDIDMTVGIWLEESSENTITENTIIKNGVGLNLEESNKNTITYNDIEKNHALLKILFFGWSGGLNLLRSDDNIISSNNFKGNSPHAFFKFCTNNWTHNYWGRPRIAPKVIFGLTSGGWMEPPKLIFEFDFFPAKLPIT